MKINKGETKMKNSKIIVAFIILLLIFSVKVLADENYEINYENQYEYNEEIHNEGISIENEELFNYLIEQSKACNELIDVSDYQILETEAKAVITKFFLNEEVYYVSSVAATSYENGYLKEITVSYTLSQEEISSYDQQLKQVCEKFLSGVNSNWLDIEKVLYTDIFICKNVEYEYEDSNISHTIVGALINKVAFSDGYAKAFNYLFKQTGGEASIVTSNSSAISWSMVQIDGTYYHVDCYSNDMQGYGKTSYEYLIKSDEYMMNCFGLEWVSDYVSEPEVEYDYADWLYADTYLEYKDGYWYYLYNNKNGIELDRYDFSIDEAIFPDGFIIEESFVWTPGFTYDGENFYGSTNDAIYIINYDFDTGEPSYELYFSLEDSDKVIYSIEYVDR